MASSFFLDGSMIPRSEKRTIDERGEVRHPSLSSTAVLEFRGRKHMVRLVNVSSSAPYVEFSQALRCRTSSPVWHHADDRTTGGGLQ